MNKKQAVKNHSRRQKKNRGSAVIEMTLLMPIYLGIFYLYILFFLFLIECGFLMQCMLEYVYQVEMKYDVLENNADISITNHGNIRTVRTLKMDKGFQIQLELKGNTEDPAERIRRWQIAVDTVS